MKFRGCERPSLDHDVLEENRRLLSSNGLWVPQALPLLGRTSVRDVRDLLFVSSSLTKEQTPLKPFDAPREHHWPHDLQVASDRKTGCHRSLPNMAQNKTVEVIDRKQGSTQGIIWEPISLHSSVPSASILFHSVSSMTERPENSAILQGLAQAVAAAPGRARLCSQLEEFEDCRYFLLSEPKSDAVMLSFASAYPLPEESLQAVKHAYDRTAQLRSTAQKGYQVTLEVSLVAINFTPAQLAGKLTLLARCRCHLPPFAALVSKNNESGCASCPGYAWLPSEHRSGPCYAPWAAAPSSAGQALHSSCSPHQTLLPCSSRSGSGTLGTRSSQWPLSRSL